MKLTKRMTLKLPPPLVALLVYTLFMLLLILSLKHMTLVAAPLFFAFVLAYLFNPVVNYLEKKTFLSRGPAAGLLMVVLALLFVFLIVNLFPYAVEQVKNAADKFPEILEKFSQKMKGFNEYIDKTFPDYAGQIDIMGKIKEMIADLLTNLSNILGTAFTSLYAFMVTLVYLVFVPLFAYYFLKDYKKIQRVFFELVPLRFKERTITRVEKLDTILSSFIRGQGIVVLILAILYSLGLSLIGLPFAILIGVFAGFGDIVPYFGSVVGLLLSLIVGITHFQSIESVLLIILVFAVVKGGENWFFYPKIVGKEVGLHFVWVLLSIVFFGKLFGFWGLLVAIPTAAGFKMYAKDLIIYYKNSAFFNKE